MKRARQRGVAAIELALVIVATFFVMPAMFLFSRVFYQYNVLKQATQDTAFYMASLSPAEIRNSGTALLAASRAKLMLREAILAAGIASPATDISILCGTSIDCGAGVVPNAVSVSATVTLVEDTSLANFTFPWLGGDYFTWPITKTTTVPYAR